MRIATAIVAMLCGAIMVNGCGGGGGGSSAPSGTTGSTTGGTTGSTGGSIPHGYAVTVLPLLPSGTYTFGTAINNAGEVVGQGDSGTNTRAIAWINGHAQNLLPTGGDSAASGVNDSGAVVGSGPGSGAFYVASGHVTAVSSGQPFSISASGKVPLAGGLVPSIWQNGTVTFLSGLSGAESTEVTTISPNGTSAGDAVISAGNDHAVLWQGSTAVDIGSLEPSGSTGIVTTWAVNDSGTVVGGSDGATGHHAFVYHAGVMTDIGTLTGMTSGDSEARAINRAGVVAGVSNSRAMVWFGGTMKDLNSLTPAGSGIFLSSATGINDSGQICGTGTVGGAQRAFLLTPTS